VKVYIDAKFQGGGKSVETDGLNVLGNVLASMSARSQNMVKVMGAIGTVMIKSVHDTFDAQGKPTKWKERSEFTDMLYMQQAERGAKSTKRYQSAKRESTQNRLLTKASVTKLGNRILMDSGALRNSIMLGIVTYNSVEIGSSLVYSRIHQLGGTITPKKAQYLRAGGYFPLKKGVIPGRPYLGFQAEDVPVITRLLMRFIKEGV